MGNMNFVSMRELRNSTSKINEMLTDDGKIIVTSKGKPKALYKTIKDAKTRADILRKEIGADVRPYECPAGKGWHLTHTTGPRK